LTPSLVSAKVLPLEISDKDNVKLILSDIKKKGGVTDE
jgi:hypothetical protein